MGNSYHVPSQILADQAIKTADLYMKDSDENKAKLDGIGLPASMFGEVKNLGEQVNAAEQEQEIAKTDAVVEKEESTAATLALMVWRKDEVLRRVKLALRKDGRLRHFRPGKLRSVRAATVIRECRLIVDAIKRFSNLPELQKRGVTAAMAERGAELISVAEKEDTEAAAAAMTQMDVTENIYKLEDKLDDLLAEIERSAAALFEPESASLRRYRMNEIRNYVATMHGKKSSKTADTTASVEVPDPDPTAPSVP